MNGGRKIKLVQNFENDWKIQTKYNKGKLITMKGGKPLNSPGYAKRGNDSSLTPYHNNTRTYQIPPIITSIFRTPYNCTNILKSNNHGPSGPVITHVNQTNAESTQIPNIKLKVQGEFYTTNIRQGILKLEQNVKSVKI